MFLKSFNSFLAFPKGHAPSSEIMPLYCTMVGSLAHLDTWDAGVGRSKVLTNLTLVQVTWIHGMLE